MVRVAGLTPALVGDREWREVERFRGFTICAITTVYKQVRAT